MKRFKIAQFFAVLGLQSVVSTLENIRAVSTSRNLGDDYALEELYLQRMDMNLTACWWFKREADQTAGIDGIMSLTSPGMHKKNQMVPSFTLLTLLLFGDSDSNSNNFVSRIFF